MIDLIPRVSARMVGPCLLFSGLCLGIVSTAKAATTKPFGKTPPISEAYQTGNPADESTEDGSRSSLFPIKAFHWNIRQERIAALKKIDRERIATLDYLTKERNAVLLEIDNERKATLEYQSRERGVVVKELKTELNRLIDILLAERRTTMLELEASRQLNGQGRPARQ